MRAIYKASLVFLLKDIYSKLPVTGAVILCNGKQNPYTRKADGYYVFSNFYPGDYNVNITCKGYTDVNLFISLKENETKIMSLDMSYATDNVNLMRLTRFEMTLVHKKELLANKDVKLILKSELPFLKLVEPASVGDTSLALNFDEMVSGILGQKYIYKVKRSEQEILILGYDSPSKRYTILNSLPKKMDIGGKFYAVWNVKTDQLGRLTFPLMNVFMKGESVEFECQIDNLKGGVSFDIKNKQQSGEVFYADVRLKKHK